MSNFSLIVRCFTCGTQEEMKPPFGSHTSDVLRRFANVHGVSSGHEAEVEQDGVVTTRWSERKATATR